MSEDINRLERALYSIRNAAGSAQQFTNRLQFIYERASCALRGEEWDETWKAQYGYRVRDKVMRENEELRQRITELETQLAEIDGREATASSAAGDTTARA